MADFNSLEKQIDTLARAMVEGFESVEERFEKVDERFEKIDERFKKIDERFEKIDKRFDKIDQTLERTERNQLTQKEEIISLDTRVANLEHPVAH